MASKRTDNTTLISGVIDEYCENTYHVPVWYESIGSYKWGQKDGVHCNVKTGGKENDWFTEKFSIGKGGNKLIPFIIFKGEDTA